MSRADLVKARTAARRRMQTVDVTLVWGAPCSGKTTYVREHMQPGDVVVDYDALAVALGSPDTHDHPRELNPFILTARDAVIDRLSRAKGIRRAWIIRCDPTQADFDRAIDVVHMAVDADTCKARAVAAGRPERWVSVIDQWYARHAV